MNSHLHPTMNSSSVLLPTGSGSKYHRGGEDIVDGMTFGFAPSGHKCPEQKDKQDIFAKNRKIALAALGYMKLPEPSGPMPEKPAEYCHIEEIMKAPLTQQVIKQYFRPYIDETTRSDPLNPYQRIISQTHIARMKQLVEFFPDGIADDYFIDIYAKILGNAPNLSGYSFPKDNDRRTSFHLRSVFWIPDNDIYQLPKRLLFPVESSKKYSGSLQSLLQQYWHLLVKFMENQKVVYLNDEFDFEDNDELFHAKTGIWFSYKRWGLFSYDNFFELMVENFDPDNNLFTILRLPSDEPGCLRQRVFLLATGKDRDFARKFEQKECEKFCGSRKVVTQEQTPPVVKEHTSWRVDNMKFTTLDGIRMKEYDSREFDAVAAGNIQDFYLFHVLLTKDIPQRDTLLQRIHDLVCGKSNFTVPDPIIEKSVVTFLNTKRMWRRGIILDHNKANDTVKVLDIDTGETKTNVAANSLRNITSTLFHLPVLAVPVRFCVHRNLRKHFIGNSEGNCVLGKYLHMILVEANKGLRLRFFKWDAEYTHYLPGVFVVKGFLIDIIQKNSLSPRVSISDYLLEKFKNRKQDEILPEWVEESGTEDEDWSIPVMRERLPSIMYMIHYHTGTGQCHRDDFGVNMFEPTIPRELQVDKDRENQSDALIFRDDEYGDGQAPLQFYPKRLGIRGSFKSNVITNRLEQEEKRKKAEIVKKCISLSPGVSNIKAKDQIVLTISKTNLDTINQKRIIVRSKLSSNDKLKLEKLKRKGLIKIPVTLITE